MIYNENYQTNSNFFGHPVLMVKATDILKTQFIVPVNNIHLESLGNKELQSLVF